MCPAGRYRAGVRMGDRLAARCPAGNRNRLGSRRAAKLWSLRSLHGNPPTQGSFSADMGTISVPEELRGGSSGSLLTLCDFLPDPVCRLVESGIIKHVGEQPSAIILGLADGHECLVGRLADAIGNAG